MSRGWWRSSPACRRSVARSPTSRSASTPTPPPSPPSPTSRSAPAWSCSCCHGRFRSGCTVSNKTVAAALAAVLSLSGCAALEGKPEGPPPVVINEDPYPSTYVRYPGVPTVIRHATVLDGEGRQISDGSVVIADGVIKALGGAGFPAPAGAVEVDGSGKWVTPGI